MKSKQDMIREWLDRGLIMIHLNSKATGVVLPSSVARASESPDHVRINLSWHFRVPLSLDEDAIHTTLSFSGVPFECIIPWDAIFAVSRQGADPYVWGAYVPPGVMRRWTDEIAKVRQREAEDAQKQAEYQAKKARFSIVKN